MDNVKTTKLMSKFFKLIADEIRDNHVTWPELQISIEACRLFNEMDPRAKDVTLEEKAGLTNAAKNYLMVLGFSDRETEVEMLDGSIKEFSDKDN